MADATLKRAVVISNPQGLHLRSAELFVTLASRYQSKIEVVRESQRVDGKSILNLVTLAAVEGTHLSIEATGPDAESALTALAELIERNFDENGNAK